MDFQQTSNTLVDAILQRVTEEDERQHLFERSVMHEEDLVAVLRVHLFVEVRLVELLAIKYPGAEDLVQRLNYTAKVNQAVKCGLLPKPYAKLLHALGELRNSFTHPPIKVTVTSEDVDRLMKAAPGPHVKQFRTLMEREDSPNTLPNRLRLHLQLIDLMMQAVVDVRSGRRGQPSTSPKS